MFLCFSYIDGSKKKIQKKKKKTSCFLFLFLQHYFGQVELKKERKKKILTRYHLF